MTMSLPTDRELPDVKPTSPKLLALLPNIKSLSITTLLSIVAPR